MRGFFIFLGTGASAGVPLIGCKCPICISPSSFNKRLRSAGWIQIEERSFLIDVGPDFRQQALRAGIDKVDGLLLTHTHADHIAGIDDLRIFCVRHKRPIPCLLAEESLTDLKNRYEYFFEKKGRSQVVQFSYQVLQDSQGEVEFQNLNIRYFSYSQGGMKVTGYRLGNFAYVSDIRDYDESIFEALKGVEILVVSALKAEPSDLHLSIDEAVELARKVGARQTWITHLSHFVEHHETNRQLPCGIQLAYDGLELEFEIYT